MAITITEQPTNFARVGQKLMVVATSTNVGQPNFRFVVRVSDNASADIDEVLVPPNPSNVLMFDLRFSVHTHISKVKAINEDGSLFINNSTEAFVVDQNGNNCCIYDIAILEAYDVAGVFTVNESSIVYAIHDETHTNFIAINAHYKITDGYKPDPNLTYSLSSTTSLLMGSRKPNTHYHNGTIQPAHTNQRVFIPVRSSELDWGCLCMIAQNISSEYGLNTTVDAVCRMTLFESDGTPNIANLNTYGNQDYSDIGYLQVYPANLNAHGELLRPADYPNWRYYDIAIYDSANSSRKSALYTFYPVDDDCRFDNVRLAWWDDEVGGFDFFNFTKKNEQSVEVERKRIKLVVGTYSASTFSFNTFDSELKEGFIDAVDYIDITSDWIQEGEFELLKHLVRSEAVYIVGDDGSLTPVLVENSSYTAKKERSAKLYNQTFRLRYSQQQIR